MKPSERLEKLLHDHTSSPFLFIGSGFSQRYLGLPTWENLIKKFCVLGTPFSSYQARADSLMPRCASLLAKDYAEQWDLNPLFADLRAKHGTHIVNSSSALKVSILDYLLYSTGFKKDAALMEELQALRSLNAEGIISTNWDRSLESLFPDYRVFIGQQSIVRDTPHGIAEIYKIHGCCSEPNSLILTEEDYGRFHEKQAYLAAKLITIFVEHPVVFIGYSITDPNILALLKSILNGLGPDEIAKLQHNLIFLQRERDDRPEGIREKYIIS